VKQFVGCCALAAELLHRPDKAGRGHCGHSFVRVHRRPLAGAAGCNAASPCTLPCNRQV